MDIRNAFISSSNDIELMLSLEEMLLDLEDNNIENMIDFICNNFINVFVTQKKKLFFLFNCVSCVRPKKEQIYQNLMERIKPFFIIDYPYLMFYLLSINIKCSLTSEEKYRWDINGQFSDYDSKTMIYYDKDQKIIIDILKNDDVEGFQDFTSQTNMKIKENLLNLPDLLYSIPFNKSKKSNAIEMAAFFGSFSIFKYLLLQYQNDSHEELSKALPEHLAEYAVVGGNYEIIHILEQNNVKFTSFSLIIAVIYHRNEIFDYFLELSGAELQLIHFEAAAMAGNFIIMKKFIDEKSKDLFNSLYYDENRDVKYYQSAVYNISFMEILSKIETKTYFEVFDRRLFFLQQSALNTIVSVFKNYAKYQNVSYFFSYSLSIHQNEDNKNQQLEKNRVMDTERNLEDFFVKEYLAIFKLATERNELEIIILLLLLLFKEKEEENEIIINRIFNYDTVARFFNAAVCANYPNIVDYFLNNEGSLFGEMIYLLIWGKSNGNRINYKVEVQEIFNKNNVLLKPIMKGENELFELLIKSDKIDVNKYSIIKTIYDRKNIEQMKLLLTIRKDDIDVNTVKFLDRNKAFYSQISDALDEDEPRSSVLHDACFDNEIEFVKILLDFPKTNINLIDDFGETPLHVACKAGNLEIARILMNADLIDTDINDQFGVLFSYKYNIYIYIYKIILILEF